MRKFVLLLSIMGTSLMGPSAQSSCFFAKEGDQILFEEGDVKARHYPYSTFKPLLAYAAFESGFFEKKDAPEFEFKTEYEKNFQSWYTREKGKEYHWCESQTPATFMKNSVVWISHLITQHLGKEKFQELVSKFNYGNEDVSGTPGRDDGLINSWLGTSLQISAEEQIEILKKLFATNLGLSQDAQEKTREIMDRAEKWGEWVLKGKTGGGKGMTGWFFGWIENGDRRIFFARYVEQAQEGSPAGIQAKDYAKEKLKKVI